MSKDFGAEMLELLRQSARVTDMEIGPALPLSKSGAKTYEVRYGVTSFYYAGEAWVAPFNCGEVLRKNGYKHEPFQVVPFTHGNFSELEKLIREQKSHSTFKTELYEIFGEQAELIYDNVGKLVKEWLVITDVERIPGHKALKVFGMTADGNKVFVKVQHEEDTKNEVGVIKALNELEYGFAPILFSEPVYAEGIGIHATYDVKFKMPIPSKIPPIETMSDPHALKIYSYALLHSMTPEIRMKTRLPEYKFTPEVFSNGIKALEFARGFLQFDEISSILIKKFQEFMKSGQDYHFGQSRLGKLAYAIINGDPRDENIVNDINVDWNSSVLGPYTIDLIKGTSEIPKNKRDYYLQLYINFRNDLEPEFRDLGITLDDVKRDMKLKSYVFLRAAGTRIGDTQKADAYTCRLLNQAAYS